MSDFDKIINNRLNEDDGEFFPRKEFNWEKLSQRLDDFEAANPLNDFDNIINDRLNGDEGEFFPRRGMNWEKLSQRLEDFETANPLPTEVPTPVLKPVWRRWAWASAAAAALVGVSGLLFWHFNEVKSLEQRNADLEQKIVEFKNKSNDTDAFLGKTTIVKRDTIYRTTERIVEQSATVSSPKKGTQSPTILNNRSGKTPIAQKEMVAGMEHQQSNTPQNKQNSAILDNESNGHQRGTAKTENPKEAFNPKRNGSQIATVDPKNGLNTMPFDEKKVSIDEQKKTLNESILIQKDPSVSDATKINGTQNKPNGTTISPIEVGDIKIESIDKKNLETIAETTYPTKEASNVPTTGLVQNENKTAENTPVPPIIKPPKDWKKWKAILPKGFAVGLEGLYGSVLPRIQGVMPTTGKGISAELMVTKSFSLVGSADLLEKHFELGERPRRFHVKDEPNPPKPNVELRHFRGEEHSRLLSLNAKYIFGQKWWAQPSVYVGHSWQKIQEHPVNYVFQDLSTSEETVVPVQVETEKIKGLWQAGIGVEKKIKRFSFAVSAEIQRDFSNQKDVNGRQIASNFGILRGGVKFNIF